MGRHRSGDAAKAAGPSCRLLRRSLLLGAAAAGVWFAAGIGHTSTAEAAPIIPASTAADQPALLSIGGHQPSAQRPAAPVQLPRPASELPPIVKPLLKQAQSGLTGVIGNVAGTVNQLLSTVTGTTGSVPLPVPRTPVTAPVPAPILTGHSVPQPVPVAHPATAVLADSSIKSAHSLSIGRPPEPAPVRSMVASTPVDPVHSTHRAGTVRTSVPAPSAGIGDDPAAVWPGPGAGDGNADSASGPQPSMSVLAGGSSLANPSGSRAPKARPASHPPRERADAPAVSPD